MICEAELRQLLDILLLLLLILLLLLLLLLLRLFIARPTTGITKSLKYTLNKIKH